MTKKEKQESKIIPPEAYKGPPYRRPEDMTIPMLISEIHKLFHDSVRREANTAVLSNSYRQLIFHLAHNDGITQLELSRLTHLTPPTISVTLQKMERDGFVRRETDPKDLRQTHVYLTEKSWEIDNKIHAKFEENEKRVISGLTMEEIAAIKTILIKVRKNLLPQDKEQKTSDEN